MEYCIWKEFNKATDGSIAYKTECGCIFVIKPEEPVEKDDICDCGKRIQIEDK